MVLSAILKVNGEKQMDVDFRIWFLHKSNKLYHHLQCVQYSRSMNYFDTWDTKSQEHLPLSFPDTTQLVLPGNMHNHNW